jgi:hypothetical protein
MVAGFVASLLNAIVFAEGGAGFGEFIALGEAFMCC